MKSPLALGFLALATVAPAQDARFSVSSLDRSVDPCVDFYEFACGGWRRANPIPADQTRWGRFNELAERNREDLRLILEQAKEPAPARSPIEAKVGDYYAACMDEAAIEAKGLEPIRPALDRVAAVDSKKAFFRLLGEHEAQALPALFRFGAAPDMHDSGQTIANAGQGGLSLPDRDDYLKDDPKSTEKREKFAGHVARMLELAGASPEQAKRDAETVLRVETGLARAHLSRVEMRDPKNRDNPMSVEELGKLAPAFEWGEYLPATGAPAFVRAEREQPEVLRGGERDRRGCAARGLEDVPPLAPGGGGRALPRQGLRRGGLPLQPRLPAGGQGDRAALEALRAVDRPRARRRARPALRREDVRRRRQGAHGVAWSRRSRRRCARTSRRSPG